MMKSKRELEKDHPVILLLSEWIMACLLSLFSIYAIHSNVLRQELLEVWLIDAYIVRPLCFTLLSFCIQCLPWKKLGKKKNRLLLVSHHWIAWKSVTKWKLLNIGLLHSRKHKKKWRSMNFFCKTFSSMRKCRKQTMKTNKTSCSFIDKNDTKIEKRIPSDQRRSTRKRRIDQETLKDACQKNSFSPDLIFIELLFVL